MPLSLVLFGAPALLHDDAPIAIERRKALALLAYLAVVGTQQRRDTLAALLWPDDDQTRARAALRRALTDLTGPAGPWLAATRETIELRPDHGFTIDVVRFRSLLRECERHGHPAAEVCAACGGPLAEAAALARDPFMAGWSLPDSPAFDTWQTTEAEALRAELGNALERLARLHAAAGDTEAALGYARRRLALDPLDEAALRQHMALAASGGHAAAALRQYAAFAEQLQQELGAEPEPATVALYEQIRGGAFPAAQQPTPRQPLSQPSPLLPAPALPAPATPLIGRETELAQIAQRLADPACRLLTLLGPGGIGKTRLALAAAERAQGFAGGVVFVPLSGVNDPGQIMSALAGALPGQPGGSADARARVLEALRGRPTLLVLDNLEQLTEAGPALAELLAAAPFAKIIATSRERLGLRAEWAMELEGLPVHSEDPSSDAVALFLQRARQARADFQPTDTDMALIARICRRAEGLPLAIELAAAWIRVLSCHEIADALDGSFALLTTTLRDVPARHRSMRAVCEQSWAQLAPDERDLFQALSVFRGGFSRAAAEEVAGASLPALAALVDRSLVRRGGEDRYTLHEILRQFAAEHLALQPAAERLARSRHGSFYLGLVQRAESALQSAEQPAALAVFAAEIDNIRAAWSYAAETRRLDGLASATSGLFEFYELRGWFAEGVEAFGHAVAALQADGDTTGPERLLMARLLARRGALCTWLGDYDGARESLIASQALLDDTASGETTFVLLWHGVLAYNQGRYGAALELFEEALARSRAIGDQAGIARALDNLTYLAAEMGDLERASAYLQENTRLLPILGNQARIAWSLANHGRIASLAGNQAMALPLLEQGLALFRSLEHHHGMATVANHIGYASLETSDNAMAQEQFCFALRQALDLGAVPLLLDTLAGLATVLANAGEVERAVELAALGQWHPVSWKETRDWAGALLERAATLLPAERLDAATKRGRALEPHAAAGETQRALCGM